MGSQAMLVLAVCVGALLCVMVTAAPSHLSDRDVFNMPVRIDWAQNSPRSDTQYCCCLCNQANGTELWTFDETVESMCTMSYCPSKFPSCSETLWAATTGEVDTGRHSRNLILSRCKAIRSEAIGFMNLLDEAARAEMKMKRRAKELREQRQQAKEEAHT